MLDRETIIWEIRQALEALNNAQRIRVFGFNMAVLTPPEQMQIVLALNHAIGIPHEMDGCRAG